MTVKFLYKPKKQILFLEDIFYHDILKESKEINEITEQVNETLESVDYVYTIFDFNKIENVDFCCKYCNKLVVDKPIPIVYGVERDRYNTDNYLCQYKFCSLKCSYEFIEKNDEYDLSKKINLRNNLIYISNLY